MLWQDRVDEWATVIRPGLLIVSPPVHHLAPTARPDQTDHAAGL